MKKVNPEVLCAITLATLPHFKAMGEVGTSMLTKRLVMEFEKQEKKDIAISGILPAMSIKLAATGTSSRASLAALTDLCKSTVFSNMILVMLKVPMKVINGLLDFNEDFMQELWVSQCIVW